MTDRLLDKHPADWRIDWSSGRTRLRIAAFAVGVAAATVFGSLLGLIPEALLFRFLTERGYARADDWVVTIAGGLVQLCSVLLALFILAYTIQRATSDRSDIENLDILEMDQSLRRMNRERFIFSLVVAIAVPAQLLIWLAEPVVVAQFTWVDATLMELSRFPQSAYLIIASEGLINSLRHLLVTRSAPSLSV